MTETEVRSLIRDRVHIAGGIRKWSALHGLAPNYVSDVLHGRRDLAPKILAAVGLQRRVVFEPLQPEPERSPENG